MTTEHLLDIKIYRYTNFVQILAAAGTTFHIAAGTLLSRDRSSHTVDIRRAVIHMLRLTGYTLAEIGKIFSRHHTTIIYSERTHHSLYQYDDSYRRTYNELSHALQCIREASI